MAQDRIPELKEGERIDDLQRSELRIIQDPERFCFGMDAVLLSGFAWAPAGSRVIDLGTGTGILPLLMSAKTKAAHFTGLEIQPGSADMAKRSVRMNGLEDRIEIVEGDIRDADKRFERGSFHVVVSNPPYIAPDRGLHNPSAPRAIARHEILCNFDDVARVASKLLVQGGKFYLVHRPERLVELFSTLRAHKLEPKRMRVVYPYVDSAPSMILIESVLGGRQEMKIEKPLLIYEGHTQQYTEEVVELYGY